MVACNHPSSEIVFFTSQSQKIYAIDEVAKGSVPITVFFDPGTFYSYRLDTATQAETLIRRCAGPRPELGN